MFVLHESSVGNGKNKEVPKEGMDPFQRLNASIINRIDIRVLLPWLIFGILAAVCLGIYWNEAVSDATDSKAVTTGDCTYSTWSTWTGCENNNCYATGVRTRTIVTQATGGKECNLLSLVQTESCFNILKCQDVNCQYSEWSTWSECPKTCFHGDADCSTLPNQVRFRTVIRGPLPGGTPCDWDTLIQEQQCRPTGECPPNQNCIAAGINPSTQCPPCPDTGCTLTSESLWVLCTRSILQTSSGTGVPCQPSQLLYSETCPLPNCTDTCNAANYDAFRTCSNVCGPGFQVASESVCPFISISSCNLGSCTTGALDLTALTTCTIDPLPSKVVSCTTNDMSECMARCVMYDSCTLFYSSTEGFYYGWGPDMNCTTGGTEVVYAFEASSTNCITPTWDMVNAVCIYLCEDQFPSFSVNRGFSFPFYEPDGTPIQSCPITIEMLSFTNVCPIVGQMPPADLLPFGLQNFYELDSGEYIRSFTDADTGQEWLLSCPASQDCVYQSWSDAPVWGFCSEQCVLGQGIRQRVRSILTPSYFLGKPCDIAEQIELAPCNRQTLLTSATLMFCSNSAATTFPNISEYLCQEICYSNSQNLGAGVCDSFQYLYKSMTSGNTQTETFLYALPELVSVTSDLITYALQVSASTNGMVTLSCAEDLVSYYQAGGQACLEGWYANCPSNVSMSPPVAQAPYAASLAACSNTIDVAGVYYALQSTTGGICYYSGVGNPTRTANVPQVYADCSVTHALVGPTCVNTVDYACEGGFVYRPSMYDCVQAFGIAEAGLQAVPDYSVGSVMQQSSATCQPPGVTLNITPSQSSYMWVTGRKVLVEGNSQTQPFFVGVSNSVYDSTYQYAPQMFQNEFTCSLFPDRTDFLLNFSDCTPLGSNRADGITFSNQMDEPCNQAANCSLTDWVTATTCSICKPPNEYIRTRQIVRQATEGGIPCSDFPLYEAIPCDVPSCAPIPPVSNLCIYGPYSQSSLACNTATACATISIYSMSGFVQQWDTNTIYPWADVLASEIPPKYPFPGVQYMSGLTPMPPDLAMSLNAQCLNGDGGPPVCLPRLNLTLGTTESTGSYELTFDPISGSASGWVENLPGNECLYDAVAASCTVNRVFGVFTGNPYPSSGGSFTGAYVFDLQQQDWQCLGVCAQDAYGEFYNEDCCAWVGNCDCTDPLIGSRSVQAVLDTTATCPVPPNAAKVFLYQQCSTIPKCPTSATCPIGCDESPCNVLSGLGSCTLNQAGTEYYCSCSNAPGSNSLSADCGFNCPLGENGLVCSGPGYGVCDPATNYTLCVCNSQSGIGGPACDQIGQGFIGQMETLLYEGYTRLDVQTVTPPAPFVPDTVTTVTIQNPLPCDIEDNPYCVPFYTYSTDQGLPSAAQTGLPLFQSLLQGGSASGYTFAERQNYANICVNQQTAGVLGSVSTYVPTYVMQASAPDQQLSGTLTQCGDLPTNQNPNYQFNLPAVFTNHPLVPDYLQGKRFFTRCTNPNDPGNFDVFAYPVTGGTNYKRINPLCQYYSTTGCVDGTPAQNTAQPLFTMLLSEKTLWEICEERGWSPNLPP